MNRTDLIAIREYRPDDEAFIFSTWLRGLKFGNDWFELIESAAYYKSYHAVIEAILKSPEVLIRVACLREDPEVILGYSVASGHRLHWVQVKDRWRKIGIAKSLVPQEVTIVTHLTKVGRSILSKHPEVRFNPFDLT